MDNNVLQQQSSHESGNAICSPTSSLHRDNSPELQTTTQQQTTSQHHQEDNGSGSDDLEDDHMLDGSPGMMDEDDEDDENGERIIYPWMKKIHVAGVGKSQGVNFFFFFFLSMKNE